MLPQCCGDGESEKQCKKKMTPVALRSFLHVGEVNDLSISFFFIAGKDVSEDSEEFSGKDSELFYVKFFHDRSCFPEFPRRM